MPINRRHRREMIFGTAAVLFAGIMNLILSGTEFSFRCIISLILLSVYLIWLFASRRRFPQKGMQRILTASAALMILWNIMQTVRRDYVPVGSAVGRQIWYCYYFPAVMLPVLLLTATWYIGKTDSSELPGSRLLLFIPTGAVSLLIALNDFHQLAFRFENGVPDARSGYSYGIIYYIAVGIMIACVAGILFRTLRSCSKKQFSRSFLLPASSAALGGLYFILYKNSGEPLIFQKMYEFPDFTCLFFMSFWESLVITHMLPSNADHEEFFKASSINAGLIDNDLNIRLHGDDSRLPTQEQLIAAEENEVIKDGRLLKVQPVPGGYFYWVEDISELQNLNMRLEETCTYLEEEHAMLDQSAKLEESRRRTAEQNKLYDSISERLSPEFESLSARLGELPEDEEGFRKSMKRAAIDGVFIKRCSNLLLLAGSSETIDSGELGLSIGESLGYLELSDIWGQADIPKGEELPSEAVLFMYELFQAAVTAALGSLNAVMVTLRTAAETEFRIELDSEELCGLTAFEERAHALGGKLACETDDGSTFITFTAKGAAVQ